MVTTTSGHLLLLGRSCGLKMKSDRQTIHVIPNRSDRRSNAAATVNQAVKYKHTD
jgi:hypothetical protein